MNIFPCLRTLCKVTKKCRLSVILGMKICWIWAVVPFPELCNLPMCNAVYPYLISFLNVACLFYQASSNIIIISSSASFISSSDK